MADDWDLHAVVRGCTPTTTTTTNTHTAVTYAAAAAAASCSQDDQFLFYPDPFEVRISPNFEDLSDLYKPFFPKLQPLSPQNPPISPMSVLGGRTDLSPPPEKPQKQSPKHSVDGSRTIATPRSRRRKNQMKRVCHVPAEALSSDVWSWRKYGQKPIKGSPYPRGYYRCSTLKGCSARKQVERNRSDPGMFIVTYTGDHNHPMPTHRNSLAGSTRHKPVTPESVTAGDLNKPSCSSTPVSPAASLSPATEKMEGREDLLEDEDDEFGVSDMAISDDFFEGLEELSGPAAGDCFPGHSLGILPFPWLATTTAAGGG